MSKTFSLNGIEFDGTLDEPKIFDQISFLMRWMRDSGSANTAYSLLQQFDKLLATNSNTLGSYGQQYEELKFQLQILCLQLLSDKELEEIFSKKLRRIYSAGVDLEKSISLIFIPNFTEEDRDKLSRLLRYIELNSELVGNENITMTGKTAVAPLLSNWLKDYKSTINEDKGTLNIALYVSKSGNCAKLSKAELDFLKYILGFYDWLRYKASKIANLTFDQVSERSFVSEVSKSTSDQNFTTTLQVPTEPESPILRSIPNYTLKPATPAKEMTAFEKRLAEVSSEQHGADLGVLKHRIEEAKPIQAPVAKPVPPPVVNKNTAVQDEIKREVATRELPAHTEPKPQPKPAVAKPVSKPLPPPGPKSIPSWVMDGPEFSAPIAPPKSYQVPALSLKNIKNIDDLKKIEIGHLRLGTLKDQISAIKSKIIEIAKASGTIPYYAVTAFEQSPLIKIYLASGNAKVAGLGPENDLTHEEFEAIADLKREIEHL